MYHGKVNIAQEDLSSFLAVAEDLQVKGLTENIKKTAKSLEYTSSIAGQPGPQSSTNHDDIQEVLPIVKMEPGHHQPQPFQLPLDFDFNCTETQEGVESKVDSIEESYVEGDELNYGEYDTEVGDVSKGKTSFTFCQSFRF